MLKSLRPYLCLSWLLAALLGNATLLKATDTDDITISDLPQAVQNWLDQSPFANDLVDAYITKLSNDASTDGGKTFYDIELADDRVIIIDEAGMHLINLPAVEDDEVVDEANAPQPIKDWVQQNAQGQDVELLKLNGDKGGTPTFFFELEIDDTRYVMFDHQGTFLNASWDPWLGDEDLVFDDLPQVVQDFLNQLPNATELPNALFFFAKNEDTNSGSDLYLVEFADGKEVIVDSNGTHLITLPDIENDEQVADADIPQSIKDWGQLNDPGTALEVWKVNGEKAGVNTFIYEVDLSDGLIGVFDSTGQFINSHYDDFDDDENEADRPGEWTAFDDLPQAVKDFLNQSSYANDIPNSEFWHVTNDASPDGTGSDIYEAELPDGRTVILDPTGKRLHTANQNDEGEFVAEADVPQLIKDWIQQHTPGATPEILKLLDAADNTNFAFELKYDDFRRAFFDKDATFIHAHYNYFDDEDDNEDGEGIAFDDIPQEVRDFLNQSSYANSLSDATFFHLINDATLAPNGTDLFEAGLTDGRLVGVDPDGTHLYTISDSTSEILDAANTPQAILDWIAEFFPTETYEVSKETSEAGLNDFTYEVDVTDGSWAIFNQSLEMLFAQNGTGDDETDDGIAFDDLPQSVKDFLNQLPNASDIPNSLIFGILNEDSSAGKDLYVVEFPDGKELIVDADGTHLITLPDVENDELVADADVPQTLKDWVQQNASGTQLEVWKVNGERNGVSAFLYEVDLIDGLIAIFDDTGAFLNSHIDTFDDDDPDDHEDMGFPFEDLPQPVKDWISQSAFSNDAAKGFITELFNDASPGVGHVYYDIELPDDRVLLINANGVHLITLPAVEDDQKLDFADFPEAISKWILEHAADMHVELWKLNGDKDGTATFVYKLELEDSRYLLFNDQGQLLNASWNPWGDAEGLHFDELPQTVQDFLNQSPRSGEIQDAWFHRLPNDAGFAGGQDLFEAWFPDGKGLLVDAGGQLILNLPDIYEEVFVAKADVPQAIKDWRIQEVPTSPADVVKVKGNLDGADSHYFLIRLYDGRVALFNAQGNFINGHHDPSATGGFGGDHLFSDLPEPVKNWLKNSSFLNQLHGAHIWTIWNDASTDGGKDVFEIELPDGKELLVDADGKYLITLPEEEDDVEIPATDYPQTINDWIGQHAPGIHSELFKLNGEKDGTATFLYELELEDARIIMFNNQGEFINANFDTVDDFFVFEDLPEDVRNWLLQSTYAEEIPHSGFGEIFNDASPAGGTELYIVFLPSGKSLILNPTGQLQIILPDIYEDERVADADIPTFISDWKQTHASDEDSDLFKVKGELDGQDTFYYQLEFFDGWVAIFNPDGDFLNAHIEDFHGTDPDEPHGPGMVLIYDELPEPVRTWLEQSRYKDKLDDAEFRQVFNDAFAAGGSDIFEIRFPNGKQLIFDPAGTRLHTTDEGEEGEVVPESEIPQSIKDWIAEHAPDLDPELLKHPDLEENSTGFALELDFKDGRHAFFNDQAEFIHAHYNPEDDPDAWRPVELPEIAQQYLKTNYAKSGEELVYWVEERIHDDGTLEYVAFLNDLEISFDADGNFLEERDPWKEKQENITPGLRFLAEDSSWENAAGSSQGSFTFDDTTETISTTGGAAPAFAKLVFIKRALPEQDDDDSADDGTDSGEQDPQAGSMSYTLGFSGIADPTDTATADFDLAGTDLQAGSVLTLNFSYEFGPIRYIMVNGAKVEAFRHKMPSYDSPGKFQLSVEIADPAASASDPDGTLLSSAFGLHIEMGGEYHYDGAIFLSDVFWKDLGLAKYTQPWDPVVAINANGQANQPASFTTYLPKWLIEHRFWLHSPSEVSAGIRKEDHSLSYILGSRDEGDNFVGSGFSREKFKEREFPFDTTKPDGTGDGTLAASFIDFDGDGHADPTLAISFTNDSWSDADVQIGDPFVDPWANQDTSNFGTITGRVMNENGKALEHFDVWVLDATNGPEKIYEGEPVFYEFTPGDNGTFTIKVGPGEYYLEAGAHDPEEDIDYRPTVYGDSNGLISLEIVDSTTEVKNVNYFLKAHYKDTGERGKITGTIKDSVTGEPVYHANIQVFPLDEDNEVATDYPVAHGWIEEDGTFHVEAPVGDVLLEIFTWDNTYIPVEETITVNADSETDAGDFLLVERQLGTVSGNITDDQGNPVFADILFVDSEDDDVFFWPKTIEWEGQDNGQFNGNFTVSIPDGEYKILATFWNGTLLPTYYKDGTQGVEDFDEATVITIAGDSNITDINIQLQSAPMATVTLKVVQDDDTPTPIDYAFVIFSDPEDRHGEAYYPILEPSEPFDGTYTCRVPGGEYKVEALAGNFISSFFQLDDDEEAGWGAEEWEDGSVIELEELATYDLGTAVLTKLDPNDQDLPEWLDFDDQDPATVSGSITGTVKTNKGDAVPQAVIIAHTEDYVLWIDKNHTNSKGEFKLENLPVGKWVLTAVPPLESDAYRSYRESDPITVEVVAGQTQEEANLTLKGSNVAGRILFPAKSEDGDIELLPLEHAFVWAYQDEDNDGWPDYPDDDATATADFQIIEQFGETDEKGFFTFYFEEAGNYKLSVDVPHAFHNSRPEPISFTINNPNELTRVGNAIEVSWRTKTQSQGFTIDRRDGKNGTFSSITASELGAEIRSYIDSSAKTGIDYAYRVNAILSTGSVALNDDDVHTTRPFVYLAPPSKLITGAVLDTDGNAVSEALVIAFSDNGYAEALTEDDGSFEMNAGPGKWEVKVERPWDQKVDWHYRGHPKVVKFAKDTSSETRTVNFEVERSGGGKIIGTIKKPDGTSDWSEAAGMIFVDAFNEEGEGGGSEVAADGSFEIPLLSGVYKVEVWIDFSVGNFTVPELDLVRVKDAVIDLGDITLGEKNSFITGTLQAADGTVLPNFFVSAWDKHGNFAWDITNAKGEYELAVSPGRWEVVFDLPIPEDDDQVIPYLPQEPKRVKVGDSQTRTVDFTVAKASSQIEGSVVDASGNPISDLDLWAYIRNGDANASKHDFISEAEVDGRGKFQISVGDGSFIAGLWIPGNSGYRLKSEVPFQVSGDTVTYEGDATSLELELLANDAVISGTFLIGGEAVTGIEGDVVAFQGEHGWVETSIEDDGTYSLTVGPGDWFLDYHIYFDADENRKIRPNPATATKVTAVSGATTTQDFTLASASATITGTINDDTGTQLTDETVYVWAFREGTDTLEEFWTETESDDGTFSLNVVNGGTYQIGAFLSPELREAGFQPPSKVEVDLTASNTGTAELTLNKRSATHYISGTVLIDDEPVEDAYVFGWSDAGESADTTTDASGNFKLLAPIGATWMVGADYIEIDDDGNEFVYIADKEIEVDFSTGDFVEMGNITLVMPDFELPDGSANTFDPTKDFTTILPDGTTITIYANSVPVDDTVEEVSLVVSPIASGLVKDGNEQPVDYGYSIELFDDQGKVISQNFHKPVQITMEFDPVKLEAEGIDPTTLEVSFFNPTKNAWVNADNVVVDVNAGLISATATHFSSWAPTSPPPDSTDVEQSITLLDGVLSDAGALGAGWYSSDWLGLFYYDSAEADNFWVYHSHLGWLYLYGTDSTDVWMYSDNENLGWVWSNSTLFTTNSLDRPEATLYRNSDSRWIYYQTVEDETESRFGANAFYLYMAGSETEDPGWIIEE